MRRRSWFIVLGILVLLVALLAFAVWPGGSKFTISPQTTYVTGPLDQDGYIDYVTALNERVGKGVTPEKNANVLICQALGPRPEGSMLPAEYFQWLGIEQPPEKGDYLVPWESYLEAHSKEGNAKKSNANYDLFTDAMAGRRLWTAKEEPALADWLQQNDKPLARVVEATRRPAYYNPLVPATTPGAAPGLIGVLLPTAQRCRQLASTLLCRAMLRTAQGQVDEAWQDLLACHRLGRLVSRGGTLIELLIGIAIENVAHRADLIFLEHAKLTSKQVLACWADLEQLPPLGTVAEKIDLGERFMLLDTIMITARQGLAVVEQASAGRTTPTGKESSLSRLFTRSIQWDPALTAGNDWCDRMVACVRMTDRDARAKESAAIDRDLRALKNGVVSLESAAKLAAPRGRGEIMGKILVTLMLPAFIKVQGAADRCEQEQRNLHLAFALAAYQRDQGHYPAKLDELRPKYLKDVPGDLFSGKPLLYRLVDQGYLLYSVGANGVDDGGRGNDDTPRGDDLSIRMPVPPLPSKK
jgi:hypothetical protein